MIFYDVTSFQLANLVNLQVEEPTENTLPLRRQGFKCFASFEGKISHWNNLVLATIVIIPILRLHLSKVFSEFGLATRCSVSF